MLKDKIVRMGLAPVFQPIGQQCGFAAARIAQQHQWSAVASSVAVECLEIIRTTNVSAPANFGKGVVVARLARERIGNAFLGKFRVNSRFQIFQNQIGELARVGVIFPQMTDLLSLGVSDAGLKFFQFGLRFGIFADEIHTLRG